MKRVKNEEILLRKYKINTELILKRYLDFNNIKYIVNKLNI